MPDYFDPRWAEDGDRVEPSAGEQEDGFLCGGEGLREKFNWVLWAIQGGVNALWNRSVATGKGLAGGGDLSANRTLGTDWSVGLPAIASLEDADTLNIRDISVGDQRRTTIGDIRTFFNILSSGRSIGTSDGLSGGGDLTADRVLVTNWTALTSMGAALADADTLNLRDVSANQQKSINLAQLAAYVVAVTGTDVFVAEAIRASGVANRTLTSSFQEWALNSVSTNEISGASINPSNYRITLPAGKYRATFGGVAGNVKQHVSRLYNRTDGAEIARGLVVNGYEDGQASSAASIGVAAFTLTGTKTISLDHAYLVNGSTPTFGDSDTTQDRNDAFLRIERMRGS